MMRIRIACSQERLFFVFSNLHHFQPIAEKPLFQIAQKIKIMEKLYLVFLFQLSPTHRELLVSSKYILEKYRTQLSRENLSLSDLTVQKYNYALIMLSLICRQFKDESYSVNAKDLLSISEALCYVMRSLTCHSPITTVTLYRVISDQVDLINSIIADYLEAK